MAAAEATECAVLVDCNLFRQKSHTNPISRLLEPIANAIEHGRAARVDVVMERVPDSSELCFHVTEHHGAGMSPKECEMAIRFGLHAAKDNANALRNYSHNGIGTKACLNIFSRLAIFSICPTSSEGLFIYTLLLLDVGDASDDGTCKPAKRLVWKHTHPHPDWGRVEGPHTNTIRETCGQLTFLAPESRTVQGLSAQFSLIGGGRGTRMVYFASDGREGTSNAMRQFVLDGEDVRVHPSAFASGAAVIGTKDNNCPLYITSLRQRLRHFLADPKTTLFLNGRHVQPGGARALFDHIDEKLAPMVDELGILGIPKQKIDPSQIEFACAGFKGVLRLGRSDKNKQHRRWGTELLGDNFGTTQNGGLVVYVNGALVPLGEDTQLWKHGITGAGKKLRWMKADGGAKWGKHIFGIVEMWPPADETLLDMGKERFMPAEGGNGTETFLRLIGPFIDFVIGVAYFRDTLPTAVNSLNKGTEKLVGSMQKPIDEQDAQAWMDRNMTAACKACVRAEKRREAALRKEAALTCEACRTNRGIHTCLTRHGQPAAQELVTSLSRTGRKRQPPQKLATEVWLHSKPVAAVARNSSKAKETALRAERRLREQTRRLLMEAAWSNVLSPSNIDASYTVSRPREGKALVGWGVESTEVDNRDIDQLFAGQIVSYARPDRYSVQWTDGSSTEYGYSDLFPRDGVPLVLPFGQLDKMHPMTSTPSRLKRRESPAARTDSKRAKSMELAKSTGQAASPPRTIDLVDKMELADTAGKKSTVSAIRYSTFATSGAVAALPSRHDDHVGMALAAHSATVPNAAADSWPIDALGPKPDDHSQDPCKFLQRGELPTRTDTFVDTSEIIVDVQQGCPAERSKTTISRTSWTSPEIHMLQELIAQNRKPAAISVVLNSKFHDGKVVRSRGSVAAAWRRLQRNRSTSKGQSQPQSSQIVDDDTEYEVEAVLCKRWLGSAAEYEVKWKNYEATTWEPVSSLTLCVPAIESAECVDSTTANMRWSYAVFSLCSFLQSRKFERLECEKHQSGDLSAGLERYKIRSLCFNSPIPPAQFDYIVASEKVGRAQEHTQKNENSLLYLSEERIEELQNSLDGLGRAYDDSGRLRYARDVVIETPRGVETSYENRVVTNGVLHKGLEVFYTGCSGNGGRGYGLWCRETIERGTFIAKYVGEILTIQDAEASNDTTYQLVLQMETKRRPDADFRGSNAAQHAWPAAEFVIDAKRKGNLSRFLNHDARCPNVFAQMVFCDGYMDATMPTVAFFAAQKIEAYTELTFDYGPTSELAAGFEAKGVAQRAQQQ